MHFNTIIVGMMALGLSEFASAWNGNPVPVDTKDLCYKGEPGTCTVSVYSDWGNFNWFDAAVYGHECKQLGHWVGPEYASSSHPPKEVVAGTQIHSSLEWTVLFTKVPPQAGSDISFAYGSFHTSGPWKCVQGGDDNEIKSCTSPRFPCKLKSQ